VTPLEALLKHIEDMEPNYTAYYASGVQQFYYFTELQRLARFVRAGRFP
jgi:hypothetical protein